MAMESNPTLYVLLRRVFSKTVYYKGSLLANAFVKL